MRLSNLIAVVCFLVAPSSIDACSRNPRPTDNQLFEEAKEVFVARVVSAKLSRLTPAQCEDGAGCTFVEARYELTHVLKGRPRQRGKVRDLVFGPGNCSLGLLTGWFYVFYVGAESNFVPHVSGSFPLGPNLDKKAVESATRIKQPPHERPRDDA